MFLSNFQSVLNHCANFELSIISFKPGQSGAASESEEDTLDGEVNAIEGTPEGYKLPALKARKAHKYVDKVTKEGGYFSPKYVPVNPGLQSDDVE